MTTLAFNSREVIDRIFGKTKTFGKLSLFSTNPIEQVKATWDYANSKSQSLVSTLYSDKASIDDAAENLVIVRGENFAHSLVESKIKELFSFARYAEFDYGTDNEFRRRLESIVNEFGVTAINTIKKAINSQGIDLDAAWATLRYLGKIEQPSTYRHRLSVLIHMLDHASPKVRDGAVLGIASMDSSLAIPGLEFAIKKEKIADLRLDMELILRQLEES